MQPGDAGGATSSDGLRSEVYSGDTRITSAKADDPLFSPGDRVQHLNRPATFGRYRPQTELAEVTLDGDAAPCLTSPR